MLTVIASDALLDLDPDLGAALGPDEFAAARETIHVPLVCLEETRVRGKWGHGSGHLAGLLIVFWHLATHWGRVTRDGVLIDLPLTHTQLALLVGSERPSVTTALGKLDRDGLIRRLENRCWLLEGPVPDDVGTMLSRGMHGN